MNQSTHFIRTVTRFALLAACSSFGASNPSSNTTAKPELRFEQEIQAFAAADRAKPPVPGGILFVGSSIFRQWTNVAEMMAPLPVLNRAFGGSHTRDQLVRFEQVVMPHAPKVIVYYCGSNDLNAKPADAPEDIFGRFRAFSERVRAALPATRLIYVTATRSPDRVARWEQVDHYNALVRAYCGATPHHTFVDINPALVDREGRPRLELYQPDKLHFHPPAYAEFAAIIKPVLTRVWAETRGVAASNAGPGEADWQKSIPPNAAYQRAQKRPPFRMADPVGLVTSGPEKAQQRQAAEKLREAMATAQARGDQVFTIPPGQYRFADNRGFSLKDAEDFTVVAKEVTFWFERPASMLAADPQGLELNHCRRVTIQGLKIDFDPPVFLQAKILEIDEEKPGYVVEIDPEFPDAEMNGGSYFLYRADGRWIAHGYLFYRETRRIEGRKHKVLLDDARVFQVHNRDEANLRHTQGACRIGPGDYIVLPWRRGKGIAMSWCDGCVLEDVDEYASPGMGILESQGKGANVYRRVRIIPPPGTRRLHACAADGFHNAQTDRGPQLIECEFTATSDDFINLHGHFGVVWRKLDARRYVIGQANLGEIDPGEALVFYDDETVEPLGKARVIRLAPLKDERLIQECNAATLPKNASRKYYDILLDQDVSLSPGDLVALDCFRSAGFLIQDCYFHDAMARTLINGAGDGTMTGNLIERSAWGLVVHFETWQYFEGPMPRNIRISGNVFRDIRDLLLPQHATAISVTMVPTHGGFLRNSRPLRNLAITGNYIERPGGFAILLTNTDGATVADNTIVGPMYRPAMVGGDLRTIQFHIGHPNYFAGKARKAAIGLWSCSHVEVRANRLIDPEGFCEHGLVQIGDHCEAIRVVNPE